jgi:hypothetical protein
MREAREKDYFLFHHFFPGAPMNKPSTPAKQSSSKGLFYFCLALFVASACAFAFVMKLERKIEKTSGKVVETYSKKTFVSRKKSYDQEYAVVRYSAGGKEYTGKTLRRTTSDVIHVYYYAGFPAMAWFYKKENPNIVYCSILMALSLLGVVLARPKPKNLQAESAKAPQKKK